MSENVLEQHEVDRLIRAIRDGEVATGPDSLVPLLDVRKMNFADPAWNQDRIVRRTLPVLDLVLDRFVPTLLLMVSTIILAVGVGIILGLLAATGLNTWRDTLISVFALVTYATPLFWVGLMFIVVFALNLGWFPTSG